MSRPLINIFHDAQNEEKQRKNEQVECLKIIKISSTKLRLKLWQTNNFEYNEEDLFRKLLTFRTLKQAKCNYYKSVAQTMRSSLSPKLASCSNRIGKILVNSTNSLAKIKPNQRYLEELKDTKLLMEQLVFDIYDLNFKNCVEFENLQLDKLIRTHKHKDSETIMKSD